MILVIDNYDSFTYNLVQYLGELGADLRVVRNDEISLEELLALQPDRLVVSPGPGTPAQAGLSVPAIRALAGKCPILGVCLGHQAIGEAFGGRVIRAPELRHGKTSWVHHRGRGILQGIENPFQATRYHSLVVDPERLPPCLQITAWTEEGIIMAVEHRELAVFGVQFHPESVATPAGKEILRNFLHVEP